MEKAHIKGGDDAAEAMWVEISQCPPLAADHDEMLALAKKKLAEEL